MEMAQFKLQATNHLKFLEKVKMTTIVKSLCISKYFAYGLLQMICLFAFFTSSLFGATIIVGPPPASIQTAINGANNGDTIQLSAGTYVQEVQVISKSLNIVGAGKDVTVIQAPAPSTHLIQNFIASGVTYWCILMVDNQAIPTPQTVNISDLTVDGDSQQDTFQSPMYSFTNRFFAIGYNNANGTIQNVHTTNTRQTSNFTELAGGGIVGSASLPANLNTTLNITNCLIDFYQRIGIFCRGGNSLTVNTSDSVVDRGYILPPGMNITTSNGIQLSSKGSIINNTISRNIASVANAGGTGILPFLAGANAMILNNTINNNDFGIAAIQCEDNLVINNNVINFTTAVAVNPPEGILVQDTNGLTTLTSNIMNNIPSVNMDLIASTNQPFNLMTNQFIGSQTGLRVEGIITGTMNVGPVVTMNSDSFTGTLGYYIQEVNAPNDIWPSTASVSFDGLVSGQMTFMEFLFVLTKIFDKHDDVALGLVLSFIPPVPVVANVFPSFGPAAGGNTVLITGANFVPGFTTVNFGPNLGTNVMVLSKHVLTVTAPPGVGVVDVIVTTTDGTSPITLFDRYTYIPLIPPTVVQIIPNFGPTTGGTAVNILGTGFMTGQTMVFFGSIPATNIFVHSASIVTAFAPPGVGVVDVTVVTSMGQSAITPADQFTYIEPPPPVIAPLPPTHFIGVIKKNKFATQTEYVLKAKWDPSPSPNVILYRIFKNGKVVEEVPAGSDLFFIKHLNPKHLATRYEIAAVNSDHLESVHVKLKVVRE